MRTFRILPFTLTLALYASLPVHAGTFSVADSRAQALGGTSVALGNTAQGFYYNPALSAMHKGDEDDSRDGRFSFVVLLDGISDGAETASEAITDDLEGQLSDAIDALNATTDVASARRAIDAARELERSMRSLEEEDIYANMYAGFSISEPGDMDGGAFFIGSYLIGAGESTIAQEDLDLLDDYLEALTYVESFGTEGQQHPELFDADGNLVDPSDNILSSAEGTALIVTEAGISAASQVSLLGQEWAFGVSPKVVYLRSYDEQWGIEEGDFNNASDKENLLYLNLDLGMLWHYQERWRIGLSVRDVIRKRWTTSLGREFELNPRGKLGFAYWGEAFRLGLDLDLDKRKHIQSNLPIQEVSAGAEWQMGKGLSLRIGYRQDIEDTLGSSVSGGIALRWKRIAMELSASSGDFDQGAAVQFSFYH